MLNLTYPLFVPRKRHCGTTAHSKRNLQTTWLPATYRDKWIIQVFSKYRIQCLFPMISLVSVYLKLWFCVWRLPLYIKLLKYNPVLRWRCLNELTWRRLNAWWMCNDSWLETYFQANSQVIKYFTPQIILNLSITREITTPSTPILSIHSIPTHLIFRYVQLRISSNIIGTPVHTELYVGVKFTALWTYIFSIIRNRPRHLV